MNYNEVSDNIKNRLNKLEKESEEQVNEINLVKNQESEAAPIQIQIQSEVIQPVQQSMMRQLWEKYKTWIVVGSVILLIILMFAIYSYYSSRNTIKLDVKSDSSVNIPKIETLFKKPTKPTSAPTSDNLNLSASPK